MNVAASMKRTSFCLALFLLLASPAVAAPLSADAGISYGGVWAGSTPFAVGSLVGYVDWAVYPPGGFPYAGYVPTAGQLTYAYQVYVTGTAPLSHFDVDLPNPGNNVGTFVIPVPGGGVAPSGTSIGAVAGYDFHAPAILTGQYSVGLAFSSPNVPQDWFGSVIDTGSFDVCCADSSPQRHSDSRARGRDALVLGRCAVGATCAASLEETVVDQSMVVFVVGRFVCNCDCVG